MTILYAIVYGGLLLFSILLLIAGILALALTIKLMWNAWKNGDIGW